MTRTWSARAASLLSAVTAATAPSAALFRAALQDPRRAQHTRLLAVVAAVQGTRTAQKHAGLARVRSARELQDELPLIRFDDVSDDVEDLKRGVGRVLTSAPVTRFERTGGSSGPSKDVPYTRALSADVQRALLPWVHDVLLGRPQTRRGALYWSISPQARGVAHTTQGVQIGSDDDADWFPRPLARALGAVFAVPAQVARLPDIESCRYATLRLLCARPDLRMISVWSPTFLSLLLDDLQRHGERLLADVAAGTCRPPGASADVLAMCAALPLAASPGLARHLALALAAGPLAARSLWPRLALVSMWTDGNAAHFVDDVVRRLPGVEIQGKGLIATEGVVSVPMLNAPAPVLAVRSHFYEFIDVEQPDQRPALAHELDSGRTYEVVFSTGGGLLRYRVGDLVRVDGFFAQTPCLRFVGRADDVSDVVGEKLSAEHVRTVLGVALRGVDVRFRLLAPELGPPPRYTLFLEADLGDDALAGCALRAEEMLMGSFHYRYARELGQLAPLRSQRVVDGVRAFEARRTALGQRAGDIKPTLLDRDLGWADRFAAHEARS
ncbi:MAG: GH3 auxin-responsive promoter family protein [Deltaproteobacteria bacterium]|nr:GH3 auxin-responsive promoter family protein [Deltaproteobacteria bacterium]